MKEKFNLGNQKIDWALAEVAANEVGQVSNPQEVAQKILELFILKLVDGNKIHTQSDAIVRGSLYSTDYSTKRNYMIEAAREAK